MSDARILVVEDERFAANDIQYSLQSLGYVVLAVVSSGEQAMQEVERLCPDLILMDINLGGDSVGEESTQQIRDRFDIPVVFLIACRDDEELRREKLTEPFDFLVKPFEERELHRTIEIALYKHQMERRLRDSERWITTTLRCLGNAVVATDTGGCVTFMNPVAESLTGWYQEDALGKDLTQVCNIIYEEINIRTETLVAKALRGAGSIGVTSRGILIGRHGEKLSIDLNAVPIRGDKETITGAILTFRDITGDNQTGDTLRQSDERFRKIFNRSNDAIFVFDPARDKIIDVNPRACSVLGYTREEFLSMSISAIHPHDMPQRTRTSESTYLTKSGKVISCETSVSLIEIAGRSCVIALVRDISERKRAEEILRRSEFKYRTLFNNIADPVFIFDQVTNRFLDCNQAGIDCYGYDLHELRTMSPYQFQPSNEMNNAGKDIIDKQDCSPHHHTHITRDGKVLQVEVHTDEFEYDGRKAWISVVRDITERKRAEDEMAKSFSLLAAAMESTADGILIVDLNGNIVNFNGQFAEMWQIPQEILDTRDDNAAIDFVLGQLSDPEAFVKKVHELYSNPLSESYDELVFKDGRIFERYSKPQILEGKPVGRVWSFHDVTDSKRAEERINLLSNAFRSVNECVSITDMEDNVIFVNEAFEKTYGYTKDELLGRPISLVRDVIEHDEAAETILPETLKGGWDGELWNRRKDGTEFPVWLSTSVVRNEEDRPVALVGVARDISERKRVEEQIASSERKFRSVFENANDAIFLMEDDTFIDCNLRTEQMYGCSREQIIQRKPYDFSPRFQPDGRESKEKALEKLNATLAGEPQFFEWKHHKFDGTLFDVEVSLSRVKVNGKAMIQAIVRDITERKKLEHEIQETQKYLETLIADAGDAIISLNTKNEVVSWNKEAEHIFGYTKAEVLGKNIDMVYAGTSYDEAVNFTKKILEQGESIRVETVRFHKSGKPIEVFITATPMRNEHAEVIGISCIIRDITEKNKLEKELIDLKEFNESIVQNMEEGIVIEDSEGLLTFINPSIEKMLGYSKEQLVGGLWSKIVSQKSMEKAQKESSKRRKGIKSSYEAYLMSKSGTEIPVIVSAIPLLIDGSFSGVLSSITNITTQKQLQEQLVQSEKLSAVGQLVSGVAHELNNPLTGVMGYSQLLLGAEVSDKVKRDLEKINSEAIRCHKIIQNLLSFARKHKPEKKYIGINGIIESTLELRAYEFKLNNIKLVNDLDENLPKTMADFHQLQQVFLNIIINAEQEMMAYKGEGKLEVKTEVVKLGRAAKETMGNQQLIKISFRDTGPGIPAENLNRLFDPFFTTKEVGMGTGLGLSLSYGIIKEHDGNIYAESKVGEGSTFIVELPIRREGTIASGQIEDFVSKKDDKITGKHILVVDDEENTTNLLFDIFQNEGHQVDTARDGEVALKKIGKKDYDLILLDIKMPRLDGRQVYEHLRESNSRLANRVIFSTGDTVSEGTRAFLERTGNHFVSKPFSIEELRDVVCKTLVQKKSSLLGDC